MYITYFLIGFATSFGWWSAGKVQHKIDAPSTSINATDTSTKPLVETLYK